MKYVVHIETYLDDGSVQFIAVPETAEVRFTLPAERAYVEADIVSEAVLRGAFGEVVLDSGLAGLLASGSLRG